MAGFVRFSDPGHERCSANTAKAPATIAARSSPTAKNDRVVTLVLRRPLRDGGIEHVDRLEQRGLHQWFSHRSSPRAGVRSSCFNNTSMPLGNGCCSSSWPQSA